MNPPDPRLPTLTELLRSLCDKSSESTQCRSDVRYPKSLSIIVRPLDDDFLPAGEPFWVLSRDISLRGLSYVDVKPTTHQYVRLRMLDYDAVVVCRLCHCTAISEDHPVYLSGVEFLQGDDTLFGENDG